MNALTASLLGVFVGVFVGACWGVKVKGVLARRKLTLEKTMKDSLNVLKMKAEAFDEWIDKTEWVQAQQSSFPFNTLGLHRADVMRKEIERLRAIVNGMNNI